MNIASTSKSRPGSYGRLAVISLVILLVANAGCDSMFGCGGGVPDTAAERVGDMAKHLPQKSQANLVVGDLDGMRRALTTARDTLGDTVPMADLVAEQAKNELGVDIFDAKSWKKSGIAPNGGLTLGVVAARPVLVTYVLDKQKFERSFSKQLEKSMGLDGAAKSKKVDGQSIKVLQGDDQSVAWGYADSKVVAVFPASDGLAAAASDPTDEPASSVAAALVGMTADQSLASLGSYVDFTGALAADQSMALFINTDRALTGDRLSRLGQSVGEASANWIDENVDAFGLSMNVESNSMKFRGWASLPDNIRNRFQAILAQPVESPVPNFATENTLLGARMTANMSKLWAFYKESLTDAQRANLEENMSQNTRLGDIDVEQDVIGKMTGNLGVLFYGIDPNVLEQAGGQLPAAVLGKPAELLAILVPIQFQDKASLEKVVTAVTDKFSQKIKRKTVRGDVDKIEVQMAKRQTGRFFIQDNLLVYATDAFSDESVYEYMTGDRGEKKLSDVDGLDLGADFATGEKYNGLYVNFRRANNQLGDVLAKNLPAAVKFLDKMQEASLSAELGEAGGYIDLSIDLAKGQTSGQNTDKN